MMADQVLVLMEKEIDKELKFEEKFSDICFEMADTLIDMAEFIEELERFPRLHDNVEVVETDHVFEACAIK
nr:hypothetical protein [Tanacetum cinerariifolium]